MKRHVWRWLAAIVATLFCRFGTAQEVVLPWQALEITPTPAPGMAGSVRVRLEFVASNGVTQVTDLRVVKGEAVVVAPVEALQVARDVLPASVTVSSEHNGAGEPLLYVSLACGRAVWQTPAQDPVRVYFAFRAGRFVRRFVARRTREGGREFTDHWQP